MVPLLLQRFEYPISHYAVGRCAFLGPKSGTWGYPAGISGAFMLSICTTLGADLLRLRLMPYSEGLHRQGTFPDG
jgi:hypothetical protein